MRLSELKTCACCDGPLLGGRCGCWYVLRITQAMVNTRSANAVLGAAQMLGGMQALHIAEAMGPGDDAVLIMGDEDKRLVTELHICFDCALHRFGALLKCMERRNAESEAEVRSRQPAPEDSDDE